MQAENYFVGDVMKRLINLFFVILLCCAAFLAEAAPVQIDIYSVNDLHGRLRAAENAPGAARLAAALNLLTAANPKSPLIFGGGGRLRRMPLLNAMA